MRFSLQFVVANESVHRIIANIFKISFFVNSTSDSFFRQNFTDIQTHLNLLISTSMIFILCKEIISNGKRICLLFETIRVCSFLHGSEFLLAHHFGPKYVNTICLLSIRTIFLAK